MRAGLIVAVLACAIAAMAFGPDAIVSAYNIQTTLSAQNSGKCSPRG
jgi:hypothetical protein